MGTPPASSEWNRTTLRRTVVLAAAGVTCFGVNHATVMAIRGVRVDLDVLLPLYALVSVAFAVWTAAFLRHLVRSEGAGSRAGLFALGSALAAAHVATVPQGSIDALTYVVHGYHHVELGLDPYVGIPAEALQGPLGAELAALGYQPAHIHPSPYGPLWSGLEVAVWRLTGDVLAAVRVYQGLGLVALLVCTALLARLARGSGVAPSTVALGFLWNPVVLIEAVWDAHLDVTAYALVLGAAVRARRAPQGWTWALLAACAVDIKLLFGVFVPALLVAAARGGGARALTGAALRFGSAWAAMTVVFYAPYWDGLVTVRPLWLHTQRDAFTLVLGPLALALAVALAWRGRRRADAPAAATALPATLLGGAYWLPWYSTGAIGELLLLGARGGAYVAILTLFGRLATGVYFTAIQHYGARFEWPSAIRLPTGLYRFALLALLAVLVRRWLARRGDRRGPAA